MTQQNITNGMRAIHPGEILKTEFLDPLNLSCIKFAEAIHLTPARVFEIVRGKRGVTASSALRFAAALGTTAEFWLNLQSSYDLKIELETNGPKYQGIQPVRS